MRSMNVVQGISRDKKSKKRVNRGLIFGVLLFTVSLSGYAFAAITKPLPEISPELLTVQNVAKQEVVLPWPSGQGVIGTTDDGILAASAQEQTVKPVASMTKLVTALAVLDKQPMSVGETGTTYTVTPADVALYQQYVAKQGSVMQVQVGQKLTQYEALQALLLPSANNVADMLAIETFGSVEAYTTYANELLVTYGLTKTTIADASGFSPYTVSTPGDMFEIGRRALAHPVLADIVAQKQAVIPGSGVIRNTNLLLTDPSVIGLKTGTTDEAGSCLIFAFTHALADGETETIVGTVMGVPNWPQLYREVRTLMDSAKGNFGEREAVAGGTTVGSYMTPWGDTANITIANTLTVDGWVGREESVTVQADTIRAPLAANTTVGVVSAGDERTQLSIADALEEPDIWWRLVHYW